MGVHNHKNNSSSSTGLLPCLLRNERKPGMELLQPKKISRSIILDVYFFLVQKWLFVPCCAVSPKQRGRNGMTQTTYLPRGAKLGQISGEFIYEQ
jgi:hypothetical protein